MGGRQVGGHAVGQNVEIVVDPRLVFLTGIVLRQCPIRRDPRHMQGARDDVQIRDLLATGWNSASGLPNWRRVIAGVRRSARARP